MKIQSHDREKEGAVNMESRKFLVLRYHIAVAGYALQDFGKAIGLSSQTLSSRLAGRVPWTVEEALRACDVLNLDTTQLADLFKDCRKENTDDK